MYRTATQIESAMAILTAFLPEVTRIQLPETSVEGREIHAIRLRGGDAEGERRGVLMIGGTHARELMNPDALIDLAVDLVIAYRNGTDIVYGGKTWSAQTIELILETLDLWIAPCINPDGRDHVLNVDDMWRKNRRDNPGTSCDGVDLNRNLDVLWGVTEGSISCSPCSEVFCGPAAFSEPETRNVKFLLDTRRIDCMVDVHSYSELVLYPWGHAPTQTTDPTKVFTTLPSGTCSPIPVDGYEEYMTPRDLQRFQTVSQTIADEIQPVNGRVYTPQPSYGLYATTGTFDDYGYARHIANPALRKTYSFTFETGPWVGNAPDSFHPANPDPIKEDGKSGLIALARQCICAIELIGSRLLGGDAEADTLRRVRDDSLARTEAGRAWIGLFERAQGEVAMAVLADDELAEQAGYLVRRAAEVVSQDETFGGDEIERAVAFLRRSAERVELDDTRRAIEVTLDRLKELDGRRASEIVEHLMEVGPKDRGKAAD